MPLEIYLLSSIDTFQEKRKMLRIDLREERIRDLVSRVNIMSHRKFYDYEELEEKISVYLAGKNGTAEFGIVDKIEISGEPINWIEKIISRLKESGIIAKTKSYIEPQEVDRFEELARELRVSIGEGKEEEIEDIRYGVRIVVKEGAWSRFWDWLEYLLNLCKKYELYLYIPTLATFF